MKMKEEHYTFIKRQIELLDKEECAKHYVFLGTQKCKDINERFRWDLFHYRKLSSFACSHLYSYLNDDHIDTALRQIVKELGLPPITRVPEKPKSNENMSEIMALRRTILIWTDLGKTGSSGKKETTMRLFPYFARMRHDCPCCAFDCERSKWDYSGKVIKCCTYCPMKEEWADHIDGYDAHFCENYPLSPYLFWTETDNEDVRMDCALAIVILAKEALEWWLNLREMNQ